MKNPNTTPRRSVNNDAFTLIEMLLVLAIISILIGAGIYKMGGAKDTAKIGATRVQVNQMKVKIEEYAQVTRVGPPTTEQGFNALVNNPGGNVRYWKPILKEVPKDSWDNELRYRRPGSEGSEYEIYSAGPDGQYGTSDDISSEQDE